MHILLDILRSQQADDPYAFRIGHQEYIAHTASGGVETAALDWNQELLADLAAVRRPQPDAAVVQRLGDRIHRFLTALGFDEANALLAQASTAGERIVITLRLAAAELFALPWELFTIRATGQHAGALPQVLLRYCWPGSTTTAESPCPLPEGGRILLAWSAAGGAVPAVEHQEAIRQAAELGYYPFSLERDVLSHVSMSRLRAALTPREGEPPVTVLHLLCHGVQVGSTIGLAWDSDVPGDDADAVDGNRLRQLLAPFAGHLRLVVLCACDSGNSGEMGNHLGSLAQVLHRAGLGGIIASRFPLAVGSSILLAQTLFRTLLEQPASLEAAFVSARQRLADEQRGLDWACLQMYGRPEDGEDSRPVMLRPYRGLAAFQLRDRRFFFGRQREAQQVISALEALKQAGRPRFLVVAGASGTGKSSLVLAGALPELMRIKTAEHLPDESRAKLATLVAELRRKRPGPLLLEALDALSLAMNAAPDRGGWEYAVMRPGSDPMATLATALSQRRDDSRPFLLLVDQIEEIFTHITDAAVRVSFMQHLWALAQGSTEVSCIVTLRVDYLGQCGEVPLDDFGLRLDGVAYDEAHRVFVAQMGAEELQAAIEGPARLVGLELEEGLAAQMVAEVQGEPGALPLLEYVLDLLWQHRVGRRLTMRAYVDLGGAAGALGRNAERVYTRLAPKSQGVARRLLVRLVSHGGLSRDDSRRRVPVSELRTQIAGAETDFDATVAEFVDARLLVRSEERGQILLEVAHEALLRKWPRLATWLEDDRQMLAELRELDGWAEQFATYGTLLTGAQLGFAHQVLLQHPQDIGAKISQMVRASLEANRKRRLQRASLRVTLFFILSAFTLYCLYSWGQAEQQRQIARDAANNAAARLLAAHAERARDRNPAESLLLAAHAMWFKEGASSRDTLAAALTASSGMRTYLRGPKGLVRGLAFSPDGEEIAASGWDGIVWIFQTQNGRVRRQLRGAPPNGTQSLAYSPDGQLLAAAGTNSRVWLFNLASETPPEALESTAGLINDLAFSADGKHLTAAADGGRALIWDLRARRMTEVKVANQEQELTTLRFVPGSSNRLAAGIDDGSVQLLDLDPLQVRQRLRGRKTDSVEALAISPDGQWLVSSGGDEASDLFPLSGQATGSTPLPHLRRITDLSFQPAGRLFFACTTEGLLWATDIATGQIRGKPLQLHVGSISGCVPSRDGALLAVGIEGAVLVWDLSAHPGLHPSYYPYATSATATSPDGKTLAVGAPDGSIRFFDVSRNQMLGEPVALHHDSVNGLFYRADGRQMLSVGADGLVMRIDPEHPLANHGEFFRLPALGSIRSLAYSAGRELLAAGTADGWLLLFEPHHQPPRERARHRVLTSAQTPAELSEVRFSADGNTLAAVGSGGLITLWQTSDLHPIGQPLPGLRPRVAVRSVDFSPDGKTLAAGGSDKIVRLFNLATFPPSATEPSLAHGQSIAAIRFSPDGKLLAVATANHEIVLWDPETHQSFGLPLTGHSRAITALGFPSSGMLISGDAETFWRWNVDLSDGRQHACARANSNLAQAEWDEFFPSRPYCRLCGEAPAGPGAPEKAPECTP